MDQKTFYSRLQRALKFKGFSDERIVITASGLEVDGYLTVTCYRNTVTIEQLGHVLEESNWNHLFKPNMVVLTVEKVIDYLHTIRSEITD